MKEKKQAMVMIIMFLMILKKQRYVEKSIKEIITILNALELERIYEIKMCMENLSKYKELIDKEMYKNIANSFRKSAESLGLTDLESKGE